MSLNTKFSEGAQELTIFIEGRFDFRMQKEFRDAYESHDPKDVKKYIIDFADTTYLDSSALGMLLVLKDITEKNHATITLANPKDDVVSLLEMSNFSQLFEIRK